LIGVEQPVPDDMSPKAPVGDMSTGAGVAFAVMMESS
jgi:hypothetical protein